MPLVMFNIELIFHLHHWLMPLVMFNIELIFHLYHWLMPLVMFNIELIFHLYHWLMPLVMFNIFTYITDNDHCMVCQNIWSKNFLASSVIIQCTS